MREILFRAKVKSKEELIGKGFPIDSKGEPVTEWVFGVPISRYPDLFFAWNEACNEYEEINIVPETITEYTGMTDRNGTRIFEGDIIQNIESGETGEIQYFPEHTAFLIFVRCSVIDSRCYLDYLGKVNPSILKVIGNVHDNPD